MDPTSNVSHSISPTEQLANKTATLQVASEPNNNELQKKVTTVQQQTDLSSSSSSSSSSQLQAMQEAGKLKHRRYLRQQREEEEFARKLRDAEFSDYCDQAKNFPQGTEGDKAFYQHLQNRVDFLQSSKVINILLQRVKGDVELLPWDMKAALEKRGKQEEPGIDLELTAVYLSRNQLFKMTRLMKNISSLTLTNCVFDGSANILFDPAKLSKRADQAHEISQPAAQFFPRLQALQISGKILPVESLEKALSGLEIARTLNGTVSQFLHLFPRATIDEATKLTQRAQSAEMKALLKRSVKPYSSDRDKNLMLSEYLKDRLTKECLVIWSAK